MSGDRVTAEYDGEVVVFLIGMRVNSFRRVREWLPVASAMPRMLRELRERDGSGLLESRTTVSWRGVTVIQYWESFEALRSYAHDPDGEHHPAWMEYNDRFADSDAVGIWHETYLVAEDDRESVYQGMPERGLAAAGEVVPAAGHRQSAAGRLGQSDGSDAPITPEGGTVEDSTSPQ
jgi:hypothetical protein